MRSRRDAEVMRDAALTPRVKLAITSFPLRGAQPEMCPCFRGGYSCSRSYKPKGRRGLPRFGRSSTARPMRGSNVCR